MTSKCVHGVYLASVGEVKSKVARYCSLCTPDVDSDVLRRQELNRTKFAKGEKKHHRNGYLKGFAEATRLHGLATERYPDVDKVLALAGVVFEDHVRRSIVHSRQANRKGVRASKFLGPNRKFVGAMSKLANLGRQSPHVDGIGQSL
jgi:hypothetical protein